MFKSVQGGFGMYGFPFLCKFCRLIGTNTGF